MINRENDNDGTIDPTSYRTYFEQYYVITPFFKALTEERTDTELKELNSLCQFDSDDLILDLGCGQGRHCIGLAKTDQTIIGLDYSPTMLALAQNKNRHRKLTIPYVRGDMNRLPFTDDSFSWVLSLFGSFGYHDDNNNIRVITEIHRVLKPDGQLLLDIWNKDKATRLHGNRQRHPLSKTEHVTQSFLYSTKTKRMTIKRLFELQDNNKELTISFRVYSQTEITDVLTDAGFTVRAIHGGYDQTKFTADSRNMVVVGVKKT